MNFLIFYLYVSGNRRFLKYFLKIKYFLMFNISNLGLKYFKIFHINTQSLPSGYCNLLETYEIVYQIIVNTFSSKEYSFKLF